MKLLNTLPVAIAFCAVSGISCSSLTIPTQDLATTKIDGGLVSGIDDGHMVSWLGVPYAAPPIGDLRWLPPQPVKKWTRTFSATNLPNSCLQNADLGAFANPGGSEDCLYLNVYVDRSALEAVRKGETKLPVFVWIHGGGLAVGQGADYNPRLLATDGKSIVVTLNYRLGIFGFFAQPAIDRESHPSGNYGQMDQSFALRWIHDNIAAFGGDPARVTIAGESSGGNSVLAQVISPWSKALFQRAIVMSGAAMMLHYPGYGAPLPLDVAEQKGSAFAAAVGCTSGDIPQCLRALPASEVLARQTPYVINQTIIDGDFMPRHPYDAFKARAINKVSIISGTNRDEGSFFAAIPENETGQPMTPATYLTKFASLFGKKSQSVEQVYPIGAYDSPSEAFAAARTDYLFACTNLRMAELAANKTDLRIYEFADRTAPSYLKPTSFPLGAAHTFELSYLFPEFHGGRGQPATLNAMQVHLAAAMVKYWADTPDANWQQWPRFASGSDSILRLRLPAPQTISSKRFSEEHHCAFWNELEGY